MRVIIIHPEQWNGGSDRCTIGFLRHFVQAGHQVAWLTTMIDDYWADEEFKGVEIHEVRLPLHPGDWFSQNIGNIQRLPLKNCLILTALAYHIIFRTKLKPDLIVADHSASCVPILKWWFPKVTPNRFFLYRWYSACMGLIEAHMCEYAAKNFQAVMPSIPKEKLRVIYPPCDVDSLSVVSRPISRKHRMPNERYLFLSMNRFWPEKRLDIILDAAGLFKLFLSLVSPLFFFCLIQIT
ncbi:unnamed protein product [Meloidogyne enterolobii]|uniref:Uncharacterized protein n=1 Tax=Meloidogyne enterolobii TaxID=390850 RepID=A0ACB1AFI0_MELEN